MTQIKSAIVHSVNLDGTVNITIPPGNTIYHNIQNQSIYRNLMPGDNVKIIKENNDLSNMWIMGGFGLKQIDEKRTESSQLWEGDFSKSITSIESIAKANSAKIKSLASWQSQVYNDVASISAIQQQADDQGASIELVVKKTDLGKKIDAAQIILAINDEESEVEINANKITFTTDDYNVIADGINLNGYVTIENLKTAGKTEINGSNITTGIIQSQNYLSNTSGVKLNLIDGTWDSKYFKIDSFGKINASEGTFAGTITATGGSFDNCTIGNTCTVNGQINVNNGVFKVESDGSMMSTSAIITGDSRIGDDNLYIKIGKNAYGYDTFFLNTKRADGVVENNVEIWRKTQNQGTASEYNSAYIGGNNGLTLGLIRSNSPSESPMPIIEMAHDRSLLHGLWDITCDQIFSYNLGTTTGFTLESLDSTSGQHMRCGSMFITTDQTMCIKHEAGGNGMFFINKNGNDFLSHQYNQITNSTLGSSGVENETNNLTFMHGRWRSQDILGSERAFCLEIPNADRSRVYRYGSLYRDNLYYTSINTDESSGLRLRCKDVIGLQMINSTGTISGTLSGSWYLNSNAIATTSDRNAKNNIVSINNNDQLSKYESLFDSLNPVSYKYNEDGTYTHFGFVAQDIEESLSELGMTGGDFGAVVKNNIVDDNGEETENYYLRYNEFIALNTWQIQKLKTKIAELEAKIS